MPIRSTPLRNKTSDFVFHRRTRSKQHFVTTSKVLLWGYKTLSDGAKITYQVIDGFDWEDATTGDSKGFAYPAVQTLAQIRNVSVRTIERHIAELEKAKLLTRQMRRNLPSVLVIEDIAQEEEQTYFDQLVRGGNTKQQPISSPERRMTRARKREVILEQDDIQGTPRSQSVTNDKNVVRGEKRGTTKMSFAYKDEEKRSKQQQEHAVVNKLEAIGISKVRAEDLGKYYTASYLEQKISFLEWKLREPRRRQPIADTAAWLVQAIVKDYQPPAEFVIKPPQRQVTRVRFDPETNVAFFEYAEYLSHGLSAKEQGRASGTTNERI